LKYVLSIILNLILLTTYGQLSKTHYIPPFFAHNETSVVAREQILYLTTPHASATYTITNGAGSILQTGTILSGSFAQYDMNDYGTAFIIDDTELNSTQTKKGLIITCDSAVYANLRVNAGTSFAQGGSLTSKGISALGTTYRLGHIPSIEDHARKASCFSIMATQNNTVITVDFAQANLLCYGNNPPSSNTPLIINLNAGESYTAAIVLKNNPNNLGKGFIGTLITSNLPIAVNTGSWAGSLINNAGADIGFDQIVDLSLVGDKYVTVRGQGAGTNDDDMEQVMIVAHYDSTVIYANGNTVAIDTIDAGEYRLLDGAFYTNEVMYIETSEPSYVYQFILGGDNTSNTQGMNFVPPITCYTSQEINSIPTIEKIGTRTYAGGISIVTKQGSTILVNGAPPTSAPIPVPGSIYEAYKILSLTGDVVVSTNSIALVGFFGYQGAAGYGGYYSGFDRVEFTSTIIEECPPGILSTTSNLNGTYQWYKDGFLLSGETTDTLEFSTEGDYFIIFSKDECRDTSAIIDILPIPVGDLGNDFYLCPERDSTITATSDNGVSVSWFGTNPSNELTIDSAGTYWVELSNANNCKVNDTIVVSSDKLTFTSSIIEECPPGILATSSNLFGSFQWYKDGMLLSGETTDTLKYSTAGDYLVTFSKDECKDTSTNINIPPIPSGDLANDFYLCPGRDSTISATTESGVTVSWFGTNPSIELTIDSAGTYWVEISNAYNCTVNDTVVVSSDELTLSSSVIEECLPGILTSSSNLNGSFQWYKDHNLLPAETNDTLNFSVQGDYYVVFSTDKCKDTSSTIQISPNPTVNLGEDFTICLDNDTIIEALYSDNLTVAWFATDTNDVITIDSAGSYWVEITNKKGCKAQDSIVVATKDCTHELEMPNIFAPNNSGINDRFVPVLSINTLNPILEIYNRWGMMIMVTNNLLHGWDGTKNGDPVATGTYYWILTYQSQNLTETFNHRLTGFVQVL
jgi:gliding motility-associated-like protein